MKNSLLILSCFSDICSVHVTRFEHFYSYICVTFSLSFNKSNQEKQNHQAKYNFHILKFNSDNYLTC